MSNPADAPGVGSYLITPRWFSHLPVITTLLGNEMVYAVQGARDIQVPFALIAKQDAVDEVTLTMPAVFNVAGSPILPNGPTEIDVTFNTVSPGLVLAGPSSGTAQIPTFRALVQADLPPFSDLTITGSTIDSSVIGGSVPAAITGTTITSTAKIVSGAAGSATVPNYTSVAGGSTTGLSIVSTGFDFPIGGANVLGISTAGATFTVPLNSTLAITTATQLVSPVGSATAPGHTFTGALTTGLYEAAGPVLGFSAGGVSGGTISATAIALAHPTTITGALSATSINSTPIGNSTPSTGAFTTLSATTALPVTSGGTGAITAPLALTSLGAAALAGSSSQVFSAANAATASEVTTLAQSLAGATYANVTGSRALTTIYTNSTARPMFVFATLTTTGTDVTFVVFVNSTAIGDSTTQSLASADAVLTFLVPPGATYEIGIGAGAGGTVTGWSELS